MKVYLYLSKLLPLLILPVGMVLFTGGAALVLLVMHKRKAAIALLSLALVALWVCSTPFVAKTLYGRLESEFPAVPLSDIPRAGCIVLLGGAVGPPVAPRVDIELYEAIDRVYKVAQLYRAGKAEVVIVSAGNQPWSRPGPAEAELLGELLREWGVPSPAMRLDGRSRNTRENALNAKPLIAAAGCTRPLLVTSAAHMPRALATFTAAGIDVFPVSTDVRVTGRAAFSMFSLLPDAQALSMTSDALREWVGRRVYESKGWN